MIRREKRAYQEDDVPVPSKESGLKGTGSPQCFLSVQADNRCPKQQIEGHALSGRKMLAEEGDLP